VRSKINSSCPRTSAHHLTRSKVQEIRDMLTSPEHRHVATGALANLAQRLGPEVLSAKPPAAPER
jgi:hypothetical protein